MLSLLDALHPSTLLDAALRRWWLIAASVDEVLSLETGTELVLLPQRLAEGRKNRRKRKEGERRKNGSI